MSKITVYFGRKDALKYQKFLLNDLINQSEKDLQCMQDLQAKQANLTQMVNTSTEAWQPLSTILKPLSNVNRSSTNVKYHQRLISFMKAKMHATDLLIEDCTDPQVHLIKN